jgi:hypothetical protein
MKWAQSISPISKGYNEKGELVDQKVDISDKTFPEFYLSNQKLLLISQLIKYKDFDNAFMLFKHFGYCYPYLHPLVSSTIIEVLNEIISEIYKK